MFSVKSMERDTKQINYYTTYVDVNQFEQARIDSYNINNSNISAAVSMHYIFTGCKFWLLGDAAYTNTKAKLYIDKLYVADLSFYSDRVHSNNVIYSSDKLQMGLHILEIFFYSNNPRKEITGMYLMNEEIEKTILEFDPKRCGYDKRNDSLFLEFKNYGLISNNSSVNVIISAFDGQTKILTLNYNITFYSHKTSKRIKLDLDNELKFKMLEINLVPKDDFVIGHLNILNIYTDEKSEKKMMASTAGTIEVHINAFEVTHGDWKAGEAATFTNENGGYKETTRYFSKAMIYGTQRPTHGDVYCYIDGVNIHTIGLTADVNINVLVYTTPDLGYGRHEKPNPPTANSGAASLNSVQFYTPDNAFSVEETAVSMNKGTAIALNIKRESFTETSEEASVRITTEDVSAFANTNYKPIDQILTFKPGENMKTIIIESIFYANALGDLSFKCKLSEPSAGSGLGVNVETIVTLNSANYTYPYFIYTKANDDSIVTEGYWDSNNAGDETDAFFPDINQGGAASKTFTFTGTIFSVICNRAPDNNIFKMSIDDGETIEVDTSGPEFVRNTCYIGQDLQYKEHTVKIWRDDDTSIKFSLNGFYTVDHSNFGLIDFAEAKISSKYDQTININLRREQTNGVVAARVKTNDIINDVEFDKEVIELSNGYSYIC